MRDADATRARLIAAARRYFAEHGFERTSVRAIAAEAGVNVALISRYFGGKEELFARSVAIDLQLPDLTGVARDDLGPRLVEHFFRRWEGTPSDDLLRVLIRTSATHASAAAKVREILGGQIAPMVASLNSDHLQQRAALVATQILGLAYCRYVLDVSESELPHTLMMAAVGATLTRYLTEDLS